ncbi:predicted amidohydrolase [Acidilobus saccharovorans 345-15]|uniref:Predicted amidohydrolase n=1 Tax=Acidilobus saccharovorans (strain DSM 16705 / JCM 18335 / VKM B-2471 / 345-15) TaxID=666510 RepID=D9PZN8_ACIS3|nr:carbon-nitrogen hydrolase family protein [Acidilobus saccharovorans]ADL18526.1 predicted amidohydrolase [Acidilobus saccharovorans 345-15]
MPLRIAVLHTRIRLGARRTNTKRFLELAAKAVSDHPVDILVLPAYPVTGPIVGYYPDQKVPSILKGFAERISESEMQLSPTLTMVSKVSEEYGVYVIAGPLVERAGPRLYLTTIVVGPNGRLIGKYRKVALTRKERESGLTPGKDVLVFEVGRTNVRVGVFVDEDINYPEVLRSLSYNGADVVIGAMLPFQSNFIRMRSEPSNGILTLDYEQVMELLDVRTRENGFSAVLVGGAVEGSNGLGYVAFMPTIMAEPENGVIKDRIRLFDDLDLPVYVEVDKAASREPKDFLYPLLRSLCRNSGAKGGEPEEEEL